MSLHSWVSVWVHARTKKNLKKKICNEDKRSLRTINSIRLFTGPQNLLVNHHHHVVLVARISLTLSRHFSLSFIASVRCSGQHPVSSHSCWMYVRACRPAFGRPCVGVHKSTSLRIKFIAQCTFALVLWHINY